jgi:hypothetical protein
MRKTGLADSGAFPKAPEEARALNEGISMYELPVDGFRTWVRIPPPPPFYNPTSAAK